jgi:hypothetical protein
LRLRRMSVLTGCNRSISTCFWMSCVDGSCIASDFCGIAMVCQYSRVSGLFMWRCHWPPSRDIAAQCPAGQWMSSASKVPIGFTTSEGRDIRRSVLAVG